MAAQITAEGAPEGRMDFAVDTRAGGGAEARPGRAVRVAFAALVLAMLPAVLDQTILATALPTIAADLGRLSDVSWLVTAYVVASTASTPLWGKLGDRHGHKRLLQVSLALFVATSALCGAAQDMTQLIVVRALQGLGAGGLMTLAMAAVGDLVAPRERGRYQGYISATFAVATVVGPLLGGLIVDHASWRWVFYVNLPVGALALAALAARLPAPPVERQSRPLDLAGAALLAAATSTLLLTTVWGGGRYAWGSPQILGLLAATVLLAAALAARERRAAEPIVPLTMLRTRAVAVASATLFLATAALFAVVVFVPVFLQKAAGATPTEAGLLMAPMMLGTTATTILAGRRIAATGRYKAFPVAGLATMAAGLALLAATAGEAEPAITAVALVVFGAGFGGVSQVLVMAVQNSVDRRELGTATAATNFFRALGGALGAAVLGAVFAARLGAHGTDVAGAARAVFAAAVPLAVLGLLTVLRLPERPLRSSAS
jgi:EmrB/QacA subfamily drug resistance transporter